LAEECRDSYRAHFFAFQMDISSDESVSSAVTYVSEILQQLNKELYAVVNNAATPGTNMFDDLLNMEEYERLITVNTMGVIRVTRAFKPMIKRSKQFLTCLLVKTKPATCWIHNIFESASSPELGHGICCAQYSATEKIVVLLQFVLRKLMYASGTSVVQTETEKRRKLQ
uniref:(+)-neomenthol dehydrogenase n=1 Tax=Gongylonema pulchrum TaxID=637853 RepID=A0A183DCA6_9BILA